MVRGEPVCPRCRRPVRPPGVWSSAWRCDAHGEVAPLHPPDMPAPGSLDRLRVVPGPPLWTPWPLPSGWLVTGFAHAGDERAGWRAVAVACSGPAPLGGAGEMVLVAEEPGVGLGAGYAGMPGPDPGAGFGVGPPAAKLRAAGRPTPLWNIDAGSDEAVLAGEAMGLWLWVVAWPGQAGLLLDDIGEVVDLRDGPVALDVPFGALSPKLSGRRPRLGG